MSEVKKTSIDIISQWYEELSKISFGYETAVKYGFVGTPLEWLQTLGGEKGYSGIFIGPKEPPDCPYLWFDTSKKAK